ncbi:GABA transporter 1 [Acorus calamus]|uniref:GABA transporter 1 n=1 Tax=Acorus calamus TaxID=4465 RepID=A0AAV9DJY4_ACOCL|nr:GABA transporter 1 [Acorus calamus]
MFKGLCLCYMVVCYTFFSVAVSGYWAFSNGVAGTILTNFLVDGRPIIPKWFLILTNLFTILQLLAVAVVYLQPTNEVLEGKFADPKSDQYSARNVVPRLMLRSLAVALEGHRDIGNAPLHRGYQCRARCLRVPAIGLHDAGSLVQHHSIYLITNPGGTMKLYEFVVIFGAFMLILAQIPSFHSLRHINLISLVLCLGYSACATAGSIYAGNSSKAQQKDYSLSGDSQDRIFGAFNAVAIIATTYGNGIIPEIQATVLAPVTGKMFKGLCLCYIVVTSTFFSIAVSGYWAFGNRSSGIVLTNFLADGRPIVPRWFLVLTNLLTVLQLSAVAVVYLQPTNEVLEGMFGDPKVGQYSARNVVPRVMSRSVAVVVATVISVMFPFFGDMNALIGAFGRASTCMASSLGPAFPILVRPASLGRRYRAGTSRFSIGYLRIRAVQENDGPRRLIDIVRFVPQLSRNYFRSPSRRALFGGISLLGGFYVAQTISLSFGALGVNDVIAAVVCVLLTEYATRFYYSRPKVTFPIALLNNFKMGFTYGLFIDAFKLAS